MNRATDMMPLSPWKLALAAFVGGLAGSAARGSCEWLFALAGAPAWSSRVTVNVLGAFAIGMLFARLCDHDDRGMPLGVPHRNRMREHLWGTGFMGGFTTVSGFAWDMAWALQHGEDGWQELHDAVVGKGVRLWFPARVACCLWGSERGAAGPGLLRCA